MQFGLKNAYATLDLEVKDNQVLIKEIGFLGKTFVKDDSGYNNTFAFLLGGAYRGKQFHRYGKRGEDVLYVSHEFLSDDKKQTLIITESNSKIEVKTFYTLYNDNGVLEAYKQLKNVLDEKITLECVCPLSFSGIMNFNEDKKAGLLPYFWKIHNTWCTEVKFEKIDLNKDGLRSYVNLSRTDGKVVVSNNGTQTTNRYLPMGVLEKDGYGMLAFEIEPKGSWAYEMEIVDRPGDIKDFAILLTGKTMEENGWYKDLMPNEVYTTEKVRIVGGVDADDLVEQLTIFRRGVKVNHNVKSYEKVIYNNFQHNTWDNPTEQSDAIHSEYAAKCGAEYYVVDAGWHDGKPNNAPSPTQAIGTWKENVGNYPSGFIKTAEKVRSLGMKFGLWVEIQSYGIFSAEPNALPEECFAHIHGIRPIGNNRYHLDYTNKKTRDYYYGVMDRIIKDYNPEYIKIDYNQSLFGKDCECGSLAEGVCNQYEAYEQWFLTLQEKYPDIIFETCSSGGMRNDAAIGRYSNAISVTDQGSYKAYPFIVSNLPMSLLFEQSGLWNIPFNYWTKSTDKEEIAFNAANSIFGVMHLCSKLDMVSDELLELVKEGVRYYKQLGLVKGKAIPVMPNGFTSYGDKVLFAGIKINEKLYLAVYNVGESCTVKQDLSKYGVKTAKISFPSFAENKYSLENGVLSIEMAENTARILELEI